MQQYRSAYKKRTAILLTTLETLPPSRLSPSPLMPHRKMPSRGQQLKRTRHHFCCFFRVFYYFSGFNSPKVFYMLAVQRRWLAPYNMMRLLMPARAEGRLPDSRLCSNILKQVSHKGGDKTSICDSLVLGNDTNGTNDNSTLLPPAAKAKMWAVNNISCYSGNRVQSRKRRIMSECWCQKSQLFFNIHARTNSTFGKSECCRLWKSPWCRFTQ